MKLSTSNAARTCVFAVVAVGLALAAVSFTPKVARAESYCVPVGTSNECFPTLEACKKAHPDGVCTRGP
jgi:hypothetical protein